MSILETLSRLATPGLAGTVAGFRAVLTALSDLIGRTPSPQARQAAFAAALIALSAKMAKADGVVTADEVAAFQRLFTIHEGEERYVARLFDLAKGDVAGFDHYARRVGALFADDRETLTDVMDGLFHIAKADNAVHPRELRYLETVAGLFGLDADAFDTLVARHVAGRDDPYVVLGAGRDWPLDRLRLRHRDLVLANHPDRLVARGVPEECVRLATARLAGINAAWDRIRTERRGRVAPLAERDAAPSR